MWIMVIFIRQREYQVRWFFWTSCPHIYFVPNPWFQRCYMSLQPQIFPCLQVFPDTDPDFLYPVRWYKGEYWRTLPNIYLTGPKILCHIHHIYMLYVKYICRTQKIGFCMQNTYFACARYLLCALHSYVTYRICILFTDYICCMCKIFTLLMEYICCKRSIYFISRIHIR